MGLLTSDPAHKPAARAPIDLPRPPEPVSSGPQLVPPPGDERRILRRATLQQNVEFAVWIAYIAVAGVGIFRHEAWADEAQAWLLARDQTFWHLMLHAIRYEGSPGLWHALLWGLVRLHVSYAVMHWVAGAIAAAGIYVFLRWSPFPLILRILLPFGFWLAYQDAVVARSYVLYALLAFSAAAVLRRISRCNAGLPLRWQVFLAVLLGLMANISVHGFVASLGFAIVAWAIVRRASRDGAHADPLRLPLVVLGCFWIVALATTFPPRDVNFPAGTNFQHSIERIEARFGDQQAMTALQTTATLQSDVRPGELVPALPPHIHRAPRQALWYKIARVLSLLTFPISNFHWFALAVCVLLVVHAIALRAAPGQTGWIGLIPWLLMAGAFFFMYLAPRHAGMLWETLVASLWLTWPAQPPSPAPRLWLHRAVVAALVLVALDQAWWTAHAVWADVHGPYSGDVAMAKFLEAQPPGKRIAGFYYHSIGPAAYFPRPIYFNQPAAYWVWSRNNRVNQQAPATLAAHPDIVVVGRWSADARNGNLLDDWYQSDPETRDAIPLNDDYGILAYVEAHGYRETHRFCGHAFMRDGYDEELCQIALQPAQ
ncbi:MAG TPA: hypothetical protein VHX37_02055 [Acidobacteriaceae bacterium]|jgi:hypothetical protein|nr:hypothetical protein [Acidobacteriaceae bacterium]